MLKKQIFYIFLSAFLTVQSSERRAVTHNPYNETLLPGVSPVSTPRIFSTTHPLPVTPLTRDQLEKISIIAEQLKNMADEMLQVKQQTVHEKIKTLHEKIALYCPRITISERTIHKQRTNIAMLNQKITDLQTKLNNQSRKTTQSQETQTDSFEEVMKNYMIEMLDSRIQNQKK